MIKQCTATQLGGKVKTPDGDGILRAYNNVNKNVRVLMDDGKIIKGYKFDEVEMYGDIIPPAASVN